MIKHKHKPEQHEQRQFTRTELEEYRAQLNRALTAYQNNAKHYQELSSRPSFNKLPPEKMARHFRRERANKEQLDKGLELLSKIDLELNK